ncbi:glycerol uptake facilitator protein [Sporomusaceae bacterium BoRhaA]|uniref:MIP/aquaporin family protein n=1 Tax=Pelorhabdus rhamnosifermentans TaxID=2772457 RepID=UPI001C062C0E|nr:MIP/aquaporin family protein [Pelorhabdus rhamnosifermentans]MBU2701849.1 glycerol uptake facilitator protein [Pelorhabdus rhamnosifermentans]
MMSYFAGELFGTAILIIFGAGVVAGAVLKNSKSQSQGWLAITTGWAFGVMMGAFCANALGAQGDLNPAVTFAKLLIGTYTVSDAILIVIAEFIGAFIGATVAWLAYFPHWEATDDKPGKLGVFCTGPAIRNYIANLLCEIIGTTVLVLGIYAIFSKNVGGIVPGMGNFLVAVLIWGIGLSLGGPTGYAINPARDLGPRIAHAILPIAGKGDSDWAYSWVPVVGPMIGGGLAFVIGRGLGFL